MSCGVGLQLAAPIRPRAWQPPYATSVALKRPKKKKRRRRRNKERIERYMVSEGSILPTVDVEPANGRLTVLAIFTRDEYPWILVSSGIPEPISPGHGGMAV